MAQTNIFEMLSEPYRMPKKPRLFEAFAGIGCQHMAFNRLGIEVEVVGISEIDKYAIQSYNAVHGQTKNWGSICDIQGKDLPQIDVFTYSFPCTDLSKAGKQKGLSNTRSGLVYEVLRILHELDDEKRLPKVLIMENVVDLVQIKFIKQFQEIQFELEQLGYSNYTETMNAKDYGVAQNRDRVFMVSILGDYYYEFPKPFKLEKRLKDYLETSVDEKYYLSEKLLSYFNKNSSVNENKGNGFRFKPQIGNLPASAITTKEGSRMDDNFIQETTHLGTSSMSGQPFVREQHIIVKENNSTGYDVAIEGDCININQPNSKTRRGRVGHQVSQTLTTQQELVVVEKIKEIGNEEYIKLRMAKFKSEKGYEPNMFNPYNNQEVIDVAPTLTTMCDRWQSSSTVAINNGLRIRKLTPRECWSLMGIDGCDYDKASQVCSNSQLYKQAGNGIVVDVFAAILKQMMEEK